MRTSFSVLLISLITVAMIFTAEPVEAEKPTLTVILNTLGFTNVEESTVETFIPGTYNVTLYAEFADYHASNELSWYVVGTADYNLIFSGPEGNFGYVNPPIVKSFTTDSKFGLSFLSPEARYFTETSKNPDGIKHAQVYVNLDDPDMFLIGFENLLGAGDRDYNDMVISLKLITPSIVNINGKNWYIRNATNDKAFIFLDGGSAPSGDGWVYILSFDDPDVHKNQKLPFINEMTQKGFDCLINKDGWYYDGSQTYVKDAAIWLKNQQYKSIFLFGFSGGGVVVAYEIQKDYASTLYSATIVAAAPVDWDGHSGIYQSAHTAYKVKVPTSCICGETDGFYNQMLLYYNNMIVHKEWHTWEDGHDIFLYTCKDHPGEDITAATLSWYNAAHPPNTPSTPSGPTSGYRNVWYSYSTSTIDPNGDNVRYQFEFTGPSTNVSFTTGWYASGQTGSLTVMWETTDPLGTYYVRARAQDVYDAWSGYSSSLTVTIGSGGGCPMLFVWDGTDYVCEGLLDIHNPEGIDVVTTHTLGTTPKRVNGAYLLRLTEHPQTISHIDQVKLHAILEDKTVIELPLIRAWHSEDGNVLPQLLFSDDWKTETLGADHNNGTSQSIDLKFIALPPNMNITGFIFQIEGNNPFYKV